MIVMPGIIERVFSATRFQIFNPSETLLRDEIVIEAKPLDYKIVRRRTKRQDHPQTWLWTLASARPVVSLVRRGRSSCLRAFGFGRQPKLDKPSHGLCSIGFPLVHLKYPRAF